MSKQVPEVTVSEQERIINRLLEMGYTYSEIIAEVNAQAETGCKYTLETVHVILRARIACKKYWA